jgi:hypothetical protein
MMDDAQLDAVVGGCGGYKYPSREDSYEHRRRGSRHGQFASDNNKVASDNNIVVIDDINVNAEDNARVFVTIVQDN